jgi:hypothetical protein
MGTESEEEITLTFMISAVMISHKNVVKVFHVGSACRSTTLLDGLLHGPVEAFVDTSIIWLCPDWHVTGNEIRVNLVCHQEF